MFILLGHVVEREALARLPAPSATAIEVRSVFAADSTECLIFEDAEARLIPGFPKNPDNGSE
jgi:hypothetical protein